MSGFAGMISLDGAQPDERLLRRMAERLAFRGPDGTHIVAQPGAGFCFTFLRTGPAPQCPSQPCSLDGRVWLLGDVRLDGREDVRLKLEQHGETLAADATDEELVLRVWRRWGEEGIAELIGDYAFALWDAEQRCLRCWRDLMGARPFFYARAGGWLYFSNTLNVLRLAPGVSTELDRHFIGDFLIEGWCTDPARSAFRDIARLSPGHLLRYASGRVEVRRYFSLPIEEPLLLKREEEYVEQFRELLEQAVAERTPQGPAAIFMSGGLDSTSVAAVAVEGAKRTGKSLALRAYTVDSRPDLDDEEGRLASLVARHIGIAIEIQSGASTLPLQGWQDLNLLMPEPLDDPYRSYPEQFRPVVHYARVALNGYGGDGVMTGQTWPYLIDSIRRLRFSQIGRTFGGYILKHRRIPPLRGGFRSILGKLMTREGKSSGYPQWLSPEFKRGRSSGGRNPRLDQKARPHRWYPDAYARLNSGSWASVLEAEDSAWTGVPVESRAPLLDCRIQRFLLRVPPIPLCINKEVLRRAMKGRLPDGIVLRPKTPFRGNLLAFHVKHRNWSPLPLPASIDTIGEYVDVAKFAEALQAGRQSSLWTDLRPLSLVYWLGSVGWGECAH